MNFQVNEPYRDMNLIEPGLYLGNIYSAKSLETLSSLKVTHVLALLESFEYYTKLEGIEYLTIEIDDCPSCRIIDYLPEALRFISNALKVGSIIVHCAAGVSRSASVVIAYIMVKYSLRYEEAVQIVRSKRSCVWPNQGFQSQLLSINIEDYKQYLV